MSRPLVECKNLAVGYDDKPVLQGIDLEIEAGEIVALLGGSGCGKSTLLRAMTGLLRPLSGELNILGEPLYDLSTQDRAKLLRHTGTAFQQDALFGSMTVGENISLPLTELTKLPRVIIDEMVALRLAMVGLAGYERRPPTSLSGGQRKRAALARASILDPRIMFCDEPSAGLDPAIAAAIDQTLLQFRAALGVTIVVVTHEIASIEAIADRAVMFANGGIVARGTIEELKASKDEEVFNFFHRVADQSGPTMMARQLP